MNAKTKRTLQKPPLGYTPFAFCLQFALMCPFPLQTKHVAWGRLPSSCLGLGHTRSACLEDPQLKQMPVAACTIAQQ